MIQYSEHIFYSEPVEISDRPIIGYIKGNKRSLQFDAGNSEKHAKEICESMKEHNLPSPSLITISHSHLDHWFGLSVYNAISIS
jgi:metal-dependent hydrolase (beta-lactamase superfamily II)